jgi:quinol-cytochrome oxidoreductase complex cytochrome b subunit
MLFFKNKKKNPAEQEKKNSEEQRIKEQISQKGLKKKITNKKKAMVFVEREDGFGMFCFFFVLFLIIQYFKTIN